MEEKSRNEFSLYKTIGDQRPRLLEGGLCPKPRERFVRAREKRSMPETSRAICASEGKAVYARNLASDLCERGKSGLCPKPPGAFFATQHRELFLRAIQEFLYERYQGAIYAT